MGIFLTLKPSPDIALPAMFYKPPPV